LAAFVVPYMFFFSDSLLMQGGWLDTIHVTASALLGIYLLSCGIIGWFFGRIGWTLRALLIGAALGMLDAGLLTDLLGLGVAVAMFLYQKRFVTAEDIAHGKD
ncbi:MAG: TRAP transporter permease, partial [Roseivivax sp.]|nr:TRAP transporter permease [Roseivivax sp.]